MANFDSLRFNRPGLFIPTVVRSIVENDGGSVFGYSDFQTLSSASIGNTGSFKYDLPGSGLKSTQQLNIDWSAFENHTFFNSAQVKTNVAFNKVFNQFPFDGSQKELELFLDGLTGFEKYVYERIPKNKGYLFFSGTNSSETVGGTYVTIKDLAGTTYPNLSRNVTGLSILNPVSASMTIEMQLYSPTVSSSNQVVLQKHNVTNHHGFTIGLKNTGSLTTGRCAAYVMSGTANALSLEFDFTKGQFNHLAFVWDRTPGVNQLYGYLNHSLMASSSKVELNYLAFDSSDFYVGSGSSNTLLVPLTTFSGAVDELRLWHKIPSAQERIEYEKKATYPQTFLKAYYKFNEASGSNSRLVLDHGGNSLHGQLSTYGFNLGVREISTGSVAGSSPMVYEKLDFCPILFPNHVNIASLRDEFLLSGSAYDMENPNLITRLIPSHYLTEGQIKDGLDTEEGEIITPYSSSTGEPSSVRLGNTQVLLLLLYTWAKFFDEMKLYIQAFSDLESMDYDLTDTTPDNFLQYYAQKFGFQLPNLFTNSSISQFINAENIDSSTSTNDLSLQYIQNQIWRRILINLKDVIQSKGTIHSVKSFIRSVGIDPDNNFRIREFGGPTKKSLSASREIKSEVSTLLNFISGGFVSSSYLSGSRREYGYPTPVGTFTNGISNNSSDGLFTSGSWTFEGIYRFPSGTNYAASQSLVRLHTTGSSSPSNNSGFVVSNLIAYNDGPITLYTTPSASLILSMSISGVNIFDGNPWNVSFGRKRNDQLSSSISSSYFLRVGRSNFGEIYSQYSASSMFNEGISPVWNKIDSIQNASGAFIAIGSQSIGPASYFLNTASYGEITRLSTFQGRVGHIRFWSKATEEDEWNEHVRNFKSLGVRDPFKNFNFVTSVSGSFEKLRLDVNTDQSGAYSSDSSGKILLKDFSQNNYDFSGSNFITSSTVIVPQRFYFGLISPKFDLASSTDKIRIRSFQEYGNVQSSSYAAVAPVYEIEPSEEPQDNTRFTIDFSIVDALNADIINIFATLDSLENAIGAPELMYSSDYPKLESLREIYFNRLTTKINLKSFFEFYKWFDTNIGTFISQLIPKKTKFLGVNFLIESHMLERSKVEYLSSDIYLGDTIRTAQRDQILLAQIVGDFKRY